MILISVTETLATTEEAANFNNDVRIKSDYVETLHG